MDQQNPLPAALTCRWSPIYISYSANTLVIDNIEYRLADVLNDLLQRRQNEQVDIATAYFSIRSFELLWHTLPGMRHFRLLLGDKLLEGEDIGLRPIQWPTLGMSSTPSRSRQPPYGWWKN